MPALARKFTLAGIKAPGANSEHREASIEAFSDIVLDQPLLAKVLLKESSGVLHIVLHVENSPDSVNKTLVKYGLARLLNRPDRKLRDYVKTLRELEDFAKQNRHAIWEYGDVSDDEEEEEPARPRGRSGRR